MQNSYKVAEHANIFNIAAAFGKILVEDVFL